MNVLKAEEFYKKAILGTLSPLDVCISFDDGLKCQIDIAYKVLKKHNLTAFFFIPTERFEGNIEKLEIYRYFRFSKFKDIDDFYDAFFKKLQESNLYDKIYSKLSFFDKIDYLREFGFYTYNDRKFRYIRDKILSENQYHNIMKDMMSEYGYSLDDMQDKLYLNKDDIKTLVSQGNIIGLHSHTHHTCLADMSYDRQLYEYTKNKEILEDISKSDILSVSYPCNSYNKDSLDIMKKLGINLGFRANMSYGFNSLLEMPRQDHINIINEIKEEI